MQKNENSRTVHEKVDIEVTGGKRAKITCVLIVMCHRMFYMCLYIVTTPQ